MTELEKKAIDVIRNHSHKLIDKFTQEDLKNREISIFMAGYHEGNKANEWHYVKDELPISDKDRFYFVVDKWNLPMIARFYKEVWSNLTAIDDVIAWKEIVLPELPKEIK